MPPGDFIVWHAAAGGVGLIACQWAKALGLKLIGTAGSAEKCALALANGAAHAINYRSEDSRRASRRSPGQGRQGRVRLDRQGHLGEVARLPAPFGLMASFGNASGVVPPFAPARSARAARST